MNTVRHSSLVERLKQSLSLIPKEALWPPTDIHARSYHPLKEQISVEAQRLAQKHAGPTPLLEGLRSLNLIPWLTLAAERHHHAVCQLQMEIKQKELLDGSPIIHFNKKTLIAAPAATLNPTSMNEFTDRILMAVHRFNPKTVLFYCSSPLGDDEILQIELNRLKNELFPLKVSLKIHKTVPSH